MTAVDLVVRGGTLANGERADVAIADGRIVAIGPALAAAPHELDATGRLVLPGVIDAHVHFNEPGRGHWEGFASGTRALAAGGATCAFEMPLNANPPTLDAATFAAKAAALAGVAHVDLALWGGLTPDNLDRLDELAEAGVIGLKAFMSRSGTPEFAAADDATLYLGMRRAAHLGLLVAVHAENDGITAALAQRARDAGRRDARAYLDSRPAVAELEAIGRAIHLAADAGCRLHIVHVSTGRGVALVSAARAAGIDVSCETCPHYLVLDEDALERIGAAAKCAPPLRPAAECAALWAALADGSLPMVASDHSPAPPDMKQGDDVFAIWGGIAGCELTLPLLLEAGVLVRGLGLPWLASVTAGAVAQRFGLQGKGQVAPGYDADLAIVALDDPWDVTPDRLHDRHRLNPYLGWRVRPRVHQTLVRGHLAYDCGQFGAPAGRLLTHRTKSR
ncbi:MAG: allantoinase AllB [Chloroflexi bacterium]|nr:allantoinase AllB [Chloroflexota bacterium]